MWREYADGRGGRALIEAATKIGIQKKSLDDYYKYIKHAQRLGFKFFEQGDE